jgi:uncharacterized membrane protein
LIGKTSLLHRAYLVAIVIKGIDGAIEALAGLVIVIAGRQRLLEWVIRFTAPELTDRHPALHAIQRGAERLAEGPHAFLIFYLLVHGSLKLGIVVALFKGGGRFVFPVASLILTGFVIYLSWRLTLRWSDWLLGFALFDFVTLALVLTEWHNRRPRQTISSSNLS